jgi:SAM-dependent methyltransferase
MNFYDDAVRAGAYASISAQSTYSIAFRDLVPIIARHAHRGRALDFGCGAGRSTRFLKQLELDVVGVDISAEMVKHARSADPGGDYRVISGGDLDTYPAGSFPIVLICWALDNVHARDEKLVILDRLRRLMPGDGILILVASTPELYTHEWLTLTTEAYRDNWRARPGDGVRISIRQTGDDRPYEDTLFGDADYRALFEESGLEVLAAHRPLGLVDEPCDWISELTVAPWVIYETQKASARQSIRGQR